MAAAARHRPGPRSLQSSLSLATTKTPPKPSPQQPVSLAKRLLFPHLPPGADLPALLVSPSAPPELNAELSDIIALSLRAFVHPWWSKITRYDKEFPVEINRILTIVIRVLETRLVNADLSSLVFRDLPTLVTQHYKDYRNADAKVATSYAAGGAASLPQLFHRLQPHMAITSDGVIHEDYVRQVVDHILKTCLPPQDYDPDTERYIIREIILKILLGNIVPRLTQPWFIQKTILDLLGPPRENVQTKDTPTRRPSLSLHTFSFQSLLVFFLSAIQSISTLCLTLIHAYKQTAHTVQLVNQSHPRLPPFNKPTSTFSDNVVVATDSELPTSPDATTNYGDPPVAMITELFSMRDRFSSSAIISGVEMITAVSSRFLDRFLSYIFYTHVVSATQIINIVRISKRTLFPNGFPGPPPVDPTPEEQVLIRKQLVNQILEKTPPMISPFLLGATSEIREATVNNLLDPLSSKECNTHLFLFILDLIVLTVFPEMGVGGKGMDVYNPETSEVAQNVSNDSNAGVGVGPGTLSRTSSITPPGSVP